MHVLLIWVRILAGSHDKISLRAPMLLHHLSLDHRLLSNCLIRQTCMLNAGLVALSTVLKMAV